MSEEKKYTISKHWDTMGIQNKKRSVKPMTEKEINYWKLVNSEVKIELLNQGQVKKAIETLLKRSISDYVPKVNLTEKSEISAYMTAQNANSDKGIMLAGAVGVGKTSLLRTYKMIQNVENPIKGRIISSIQVTSEFLANENVIEKYGKGPIIFDDLGTEDQAFGKFIMKDLIEFRYGSRQKTHFTTNLPLEELDEKYGQRVSDRLKEMCTWIIFESTESLRG